MARKYYAVKKGRKTGVYTTWEICERMTKGYPGATFKSFPTWEEAKAYINSNPDTAKEPSEATAYVDGSFDEVQNACAYGIVLFHQGDEIHLSERIPSTSIRNVLAEIKAAERAMRYCIEHNINSLDIYYDYEGIEKWCTGDWKANNEHTRAYVSFFNSIKDRLIVNFYKVSAHTGNTYNELADQLAQSALNIV